MTKKYVLAGAIAAFLAAANVAYAPITNGIHFQPPKERTITTGSFLEKYAKESEEKIQALLKKLNDLDNYRTDSFNEDSDELLLARMIFGETEDCSKTEKIAVAFTAP